MENVYNKSHMVIEAISSVLRDNVNLTLPPECPVYAGMPSTDGLIERLQSNAENLISLTADSYVNVV